MIEIYDGHQQLRKTRLLFLFYGDVNEGIFDSQVLFHLALIVRQGLSVSLLVLFPMKWLFSQYGATMRKLREVRRYGIRVFLLPTLNPLRFIGRFLLILYAHIIGGSLRIMNVWRVPTIVQARGIFCGFLAIRMKRLRGVFRVIFDMRAEEVSELQFKLLQEGFTPTKAAYLLNSARKMQLAALRGADIWLMVSLKLRAYVEEKLGLHNSSTWVIPSSARVDIFRYDAERRTQMRQKLNLKCFVLGYSGSLSPWQKVDKVMDILNYIRRTGCQATLLLLTRDTEKAKRLAEEKGCMAFTRILSCDYHQLGDHIMCFDVGFLLRDRMMLNHVASPTKFAEYMLCGVPAFISAGIGDLENIVQSQKVGVLVHDLSDDGEIGRVVDQLLQMRFDRKSISRFGQSFFARESYLSVYQQLYSGACITPSLRK